MRWIISQEKKDSYGRAGFFLLLGTVLTLAFSVRFLNTLCLFLLPALVLIHPRRKERLLFVFRNKYFIACLLFFLLQWAGLLYTHHPEAGWKEMTSKAGVFAIPFFFAAISGIHGTSVWRILIAFSVSLGIVSLYCLVYAAIAYFRQHDLSVFFYHPLVIPVKHHAILFSFFLGYCLIYWLEEGLVRITSRRWKNGLIALLFFFILMILLLSSKLVIIFTLLYLISYVFRNFAFGRYKWSIPAFLVFLVMTGSLVVYTPNPVKERFREITEGNSTLFTQKRFSPDIYFNGLQFRLLIWRFTYEILNENQAWLLGVSPGDAQTHLDRKYVETNVYQGDGVTEKGYLGFNCHNVFLQTVLESGLVGLAVLLAMIVFFLMQIIRRRRWGTLYFFIGILAFCFTESVLSAHYTILLFCFFPLLSLYMMEE